MKEILSLFLLLLGLIPTLLWNNFSKDMPDYAILGLCPLISVSLVGGIGYWFGGWLIMAIALIVWFGISATLYMKVT